MDLSLEKIRKAVKKEIESLKEKFNKFTDAILNDKKPAKKTATPKSSWRVSRFNSIDTLCRKQ